MLGDVTGRVGLMNAIWRAEAFGAGGGSVRARSTGKSGALEGL